MDLTDSPFYTYVFPCVVEDLCKVGFTADPLARIAQFHPRWFEFFDLDVGLLVGAERQRDARDLELLLRRPLKTHRAPMPMTITIGSGGQTEWLRGAGAALSEAVTALSMQGYQVQRLRPWMGAALERRAALLYEWAQAGLDAGAFGDSDHAPSKAVIDTLDAYRALGLPVADLVPEDAYAAYRRQIGLA